MDEASLAVQRLDQIDDGLGPGRGQWEEGGQIESDRNDLDGIAQGAERGLDLIGLAQGIGLVGRRRMRDDAVHDRAARHIWFCHGASGRATRSLVQRGARHEGRHDAADQRVEIHAGQRRENRQIGM